MVISVVFLLLFSDYILQNHATEINKKMHKNEKKMQGRTHASAGTFAAAPSTKSAPRQPGNAAQPIRNPRASQAFRAMRAPCVPHASLRPGPRPFLE